MGGGEKKKKKINRKYNTYTNRTNRFELLFTAV